MRSAVSMSPMSKLGSMCLEGPVMLLQTQAPHPGRTLLGGRPKAEISAYGNRIEYRSGAAAIEIFEQNPWEALCEFRRRHPGWTFCVLGYDLKNADEQLNSANEDLFSLPDLWAFSPGILQEFHGDEEATIDENRRVSNSNWEFDIRNLSAVVSREDYLGKIHNIKQDIHEGEYYELNLTHPLVAEFEGNALALYDSMRRRGPVPMASFVLFGDMSVCCASPERFLKKEGCRLISEPIKGTRPRSVDQTEDELHRRDLQGSEKDRAENLMIVDLVRHDLSRIALPGSVEVTELFGIRSYATVHQMVSTVEARVAESLDPIDALRATFPMGSMTGAPKIRVMQAIDNYESYRRGWYSGAIGYITPDGDFDFNVVIRTAFVRGNKLVYPVGGAITSDSDPVDEWEETWVKARALEQLPKL